MNNFTLKENKYFWKRYKKDENRNWSKYFCKKNDTFETEIKAMKSIGTKILEQLISMNTKFLGIYMILEN